MAIDANAATGTPNAADGSTALTAPEGAVENKTTDPTPKTTDSKTADVKGAEQAIEYKDFTLPEGLEADKESLDAFKNAAKELKLTQEQAQKFVDMQTSLTQKAAKAQTEAWQNMRKEWADAAKGDKEVGGEAFKGNIAVAKRALDKYATKEFREAIEATGMGDHPELIRFLYRVGKTLKEDQIITKGNEPAGGVSHAKTLFPNMN